jgi:mono/diheme cytochrome c family protein
VNGFLTNCTPPMVVVRRIVLIGIAFGGLNAALAADAPNYNFDIRPILSQNCFSCHGPDEEGRKAHLRLDSYAGATAVHKGHQAINPDNLADSELIARITSTDPDEQMPPPESHRTLTQDQITLLTRWVKSGAEYRDHWAFLGAAKGPLPKVPSAHRAWSQNPIDHFVFARASQSGLFPMPQAQKRELLRRVTFDLTGLPPTLAELDAFLSDTSPAAFETVVDRLFASEQYGERMTLAWMDAARYGDSSVMHADGPRTMWPWRDWVINAYNSNMPFDQFTVEQLGGDLIPDATPSQKLATGFNRNNATSDEGGAFPEELRVEYIVDRVKTTANVWLGLSMECAQCHDHKYDPINNKEYYEFFAYFNNNADPGMQSRGGNEKPIITISNPMGVQEKDALHKERERIEAARHARVTEVADLVADWISLQEAKVASGEDVVVAPAGVRHQINLDEDGGTDFLDLISGEIGERHGTYAKADRLAGHGLLFRGGADVTYKNVGSFAEFDAPFSYGAWFKTRSDFTGAVFARMDKANNHRGFDVWVERGKIGTHLIHSWPNNAIKVLTETAVQNDVWQHIAVTYDGSGKAAGVSIYLNGDLQKKANPQQDGLADSIKTDVPFLVGGRYNDTKFKGSIDDVWIYDRVLSESEVVAVRDGGGLQDIFTIAADARTDAQNEALNMAYLNDHDEPYQALSEELLVLGKREAEVRDKYREYDSMIMGDNAKPRMTFILDRGQYDSPNTNAPVQPSVPAFLPQPSPDVPANRLGLAQWLVQPDHPLTSRVTINRYWAMLFGSGIVSSVMDFGNQGATPSHPELLDWLAVDFIESGWDVKRMLKQMVMSETYRQSSRIERKHFGVDPENILLSRGTRFRLQGEFIRDNALSVSGLLVSQIGGVSVKPYQPDGIWNEVSLNKGLRYKRESGESLYRRSMYTYWKRSAPAPNMQIFDAPTRETCLIGRPRTNTPLQALVTLNDIHFVEAARRLSQRIMNEGGGSFASRVNHAYRLCLSREATEDELAICRSVFDKQLASFLATPESAKAFLSAGESPRDEQLDIVEHAAYTVLTSMILNLDEVLTRG